MAAELVGSVFTAVLSVYSAASQAKENEAEFSELTELVSAIESFLKRHEEDFLEFSETRYEVRVTLTRLHLIMTELTHHIKKLTSKNTFLWNWYKAGEYATRQTRFKSDLALYLTNLNIFVTNASGGSAIGSVHAAPSASLSPADIVACTLVAIAVEEAFAAHAEHIALHYEAASGSMQKHFSGALKEAREIQEKFGDALKASSNKGSMNVVTLPQFISSIGQQAECLRKAVSFLPESHSHGSSPVSPPSCRHGGQASTGEGGGGHSCDSEESQSLAALIQDTFFTMWATAFEGRLEELLVGQDVDSEELRTLLFNKVDAIADKPDALLTQKIASLIALQATFEKIIVEKITETVTAKLSVFQSGLASQVGTLKEQLVATQKESCGGETGAALPEGPPPDFLLRDWSAAVQSDFGPVQTSSVTAMTKLRKLLELQEQSKEQMQSQFQSLSDHMDKQLATLRAQIAADTKEVVSEVVAAAAHDVVEQIDEKLDEHTAAVVESQGKSAQVVSEKVDSVRDQIVLLRKQLAAGDNITADESLFLVPDIRDEISGYYQKVYPTISVMRSADSESNDLAFEDAFQMTMVSDGERACLSITEWLKRAEDVHHDDASCQRWVVMLIEGQAGMGKSSMCKHIARTQIVGQDRVALIVDLPRLKAEIETGTHLSAGKSINREIAMNVALSAWGTQKEAGNVTTPLTHLRKILEQQNILWILDGFDEISCVAPGTTSRDKLQEFLDSALVPHSGFRRGHDVVLITTRQERQDNLVLRLPKEASARLELKKWTRHDVNAYIQRYFDAYKRANGMEAWIDAARRATQSAVTLPQLRRWDGVPLCYDILCSWMTEVHRVGKLRMPRVSPDTILEYAIEQCFRREAMKGLPKALVPLCIALIAAEKVAHKVMAFAFTELDCEANEEHHTIVRVGWLVRVGQESNFDDQKDVDNRRSGNLRKHSQLFKFAHRSFAEYFVARKLFRQLSIADQARRHISMTKGSLTVLSLLAHMVSTELFQVQDLGAAYVPDNLCDVEFRLIEKDPLTILKSKRTTLLSIVQSGFENNYRELRWDIARDLSDPSNYNFRRREFWRQSTGADNVIEVCDVLEDFQFCKIKNRRLLWYHALLLEPICRCGRYDTALSIMKNMLPDQLTLELKSHALLQVSESVARARVLSTTPDLCASASIGPAIESVVVTPREHQKQEVMKSNRKDSPPPDGPLLQSETWVIVDENECARSEAEQLAEQLNILGGRISLVNACTSGCYAVIEHLLHGQRHETNELLEAIQASITANEADCVDAVIDAMLDCKNTIFLGSGSDTQNAAAVRLHRSLLRVCGITVVNAHGLQCLLRLDKNSLLPCTVLNLSGVGHLLTSEVLSHVLPMMPSLTELDISGAKSNADSETLTLNAKLLGKLTCFRAAQSVQMVSDQSVMALARECPDLAVFDVANSQSLLSDDSIETLTTCCPKITDFNVNYAVSLTGLSMQSLASHCDYVRQLHLAGCHQLSAASVLAVAKHNPLLQLLDVASCFWVTDAFLCSLAELTATPHLEHLDIHNTGVSDVGVKQIARHATSLTYLDISDNIALTDVAVASVAAICRGLRFLQLAGLRRISDCAVIAVANSCTVLQEIDLGRTEGCVTDDGVSALADNCPLVSLKVNNTDGAISDRSILRVAELCCASLSVLDVRWTEMAVTDKSIGTLAARCSNLRELYLGHNGTSISFKVLCDLLDSNHHLKLLDASGCMRSNSVQGLFSGLFMTAIPHGQWIETILAANDPTLRDHHLERIAESCPYLKVLHVNWTRVTEKGIEAIANKCRWIEEVDVSYTGGSVSLNSIKKLLKQKRFCRLAVSGGNGKITDELFSLIEQYNPRLTHLQIDNMGDGGLSNQGLLKLAKSCLGLEAISLDGNPRISSEGARALASCVGLRKVSMVRTAVDDSGVAALASGCPYLKELRVSHTRCTNNLLVALQPARSLTNLSVQGLPLTPDTILGMMGFVPIRCLQLNQSLADELLVASAASTSTNESEPRHFSERVFLHTKPERVITVPKADDADDKFRFHRKLL